MFNYFPAQSQGVSWYIYHNSRQLEAPGIELDMVAFAGHSSSCVTMGPCEETSALCWKDWAQDTRPCPRVSLQSKCLLFRRLLLPTRVRAAGSHHSMTLQHCIAPWAVAVNRWQGHKNCLLVDDEASFGICTRF